MPRHPNLHHSGFLLLLVLFCGCDRSDNTVKTESGGSKATVPVSDTQGATARPGYAVGRILHQNGKPIDIAGAKLSVVIHGISPKSGEKLQYNPKVAPDGSYSQKLADGAYTFEGAWIELMFDDKKYRLALEPVGDDRSDREAEKGIVQDYIWKLTGLRAGNEADERNFTRWYGASVSMGFAMYREDIKKAVPKPPEGTKCIFTLAPIGKLIDGSEGKSVSFTREFDPLLSGLKNGNLPDIPLGVYKISGEEVLPDGTRRPLLIQQAYAKFGDSTTVKFASGSSTGITPTIVDFTRVVE